MENKITETNKTVQKRLEPELKLINMDTVEVEQIEWLLYPFIPYGKVTIIQGDPGEGKTTMVLQIIAKLTRGETILPADSTKDKRIDIDSESDMVDAENIEKPFKIEFKYQFSKDCNNLKDYWKIINKDFEVRVSDLFIFVILL